MDGPLGAVPTRLLFLMSEHEFSPRITSPMVTYFVTHLKADSVDSTPLTRAIQERTETRRFECTEDGPVNYALGFMMFRDRQQRKLYNRFMYVRHSSQVCRVVLHPSLISHAHVFTATR